MSNGLPISFELPQEFLEEEVRCGALVPSKLKKIWAVELDLLNVFTNVCARHGIRFQVFAGTLLGAVRHKGFIPWDDDLDICMDRSNFEKLCRVPEGEFPEPYFLQTFFTEKAFYCPFARFRNSKTTAVISGTGDIKSNHGIYMDVYIMDGVPSSRLMRWMHSRTMDLLSMIISDLQDQEKIPQTFVSKLIRCLRPLFSLIGCSRFVLLHMRVISFFSRKASMLAPVSFGMAFAGRYCITRGELSESILMEFENLRVPVAKCWDDVLRRLYGDYMKYPPAAQRGKWHEGQIAFDPDTPYTEWLQRQSNKT